MKVAIVAQMLAVWGTAGAHNDLRKISGAHKDNMT